MLVEIVKLRAEIETIQEEHNAQAIQAEAWAETNAENAMLKIKVKDLENGIDELNGYIKILMEDRQ